MYFALLRLFARHIDGILFIHFSFPGKNCGGLLLVLHDLEIFAFVQLRKGLENVFVLVVVVVS